MKFLVLFLLCATVLPAAAAQLPAYEALRTIGREKGDTLLRSIVEMRGSSGAPQPSEWLVSLRDPAARSGLREFVVGSKGIRSERTPVVGTVGSASAMSASSLNLDSTGAFNTANKEAAKAKLGFDTLSYVLKNRKGTPAWTVRLFDSTGLEVGMLEISAKDGLIVTPLRRPVITPAAGSSPAPVTGPSSSSTNNPWIEGGGLVGHSKRWGQNAWRTTSETAVRVGDSISAFFVGRPAATPPGGN